MLIPTMEVYMTPVNYPTRSNFLMAIYYWLDSIPFGFFVAGLIFDILYMNTAEVLWNKASAWVIAIGLVIAIIPRLINLYLVWFPKTYTRNNVNLIGFWCYGFAILTAILNSFVHSRDAYASVPENVILSIITVALVSIAYISKSFDDNHKL